MFKKCPPLFWLWFCEWNVRLLKNVFVVLSYRYQLCLQVRADILSGKYVDNSCFSIFGNLNIFHDNYCAFIFIQVTQNTIFSLILLVLFAGVDKWVRLYAYCAIPITDPGLMPECFIQVSSLGWKISGN